ncbi:MAG: PilZ domain-containing protein [Myxococcota bacterium]
MTAVCDSRYRKRVPCELEVESGRHPGMVLNVSRGGLFVQTRARARPGDRVRLALNPTRQRGSIDLEARVVWKRVSTPQFQSVTQGGIGLEIHQASNAWYAFLAHVAEPARAEPSKAAAGAPDPAEATRFRVRVSQTGGPRSRTLVVQGSDEDDARSRALETSGSGWDILEIEKG